MQSNCFSDLNILTPTLRPSITGGEIFGSNSGDQLKLHDRYCMEQNLLTNRPNRDQETERWKIHFFWLCRNDTLYRSGHI